MQRKTPPHHRITAKDVLRDYKRGLLTVRGSIFYLVNSACPPGTRLIVSPEKLCSTFGFSKTAYYRQISILQAYSLLNFESVGDMALWVPSDLDSIANAGGDPRFFFLGELSPLRDSFSRKGESESRKGESESRKGENQCSKPASNGHPGSPTSIQLISTDPFKEERDVRVAQEEVDSEFRDWLIRMASKLPNPPPLTEQWIEKQAKVKANQKQFAEWRQAREKAKIPPAPVTAKIDGSEQQLQQRLETLRKIWADGRCEQVRELLRENPEWGIAIGESGPEVRDV